MSKKTSTNTKKSKPAAIKKSTTRRVITTKNASTKKTSLEKTTTAKTQSEKPSDAKTETKKPGFFKSILPSLLLAFTISFMFFIFEPITMYAANPDDFWFDLHLVFPSLLQLALLCFLSIFIPLLICYFVFDKVFKKSSIYYIIVSLIFGVFLALYIQGNYLAGSLPIVYGYSFNWLDYGAESTISIIIWVIIILAIIICLIKLKPIRVFSVTTFLTGAVFIMLGVSLASTLFTTNALKDKAIYTYTYNNFNLASNKQNLFILLVDAIDAQKFTSILKTKPNSDELFKDFTFFNDTLSTYPSTRDTLPFIFNPIPNHNETDFLTYAQKTFSGSKVFTSLKDSGFNMNYYDHHYFMDTDTASIFNNVVPQAEVNLIPLFKQIARFDLFKYLPYPLKSTVSIENLNFNSTKKEIDSEVFDYKNIINYQKLTSAPIETTDEKVFHFFYTEGAHVPFNLDENMNKLPNNDGTYTQKVTASYLLIEAYLNRIKNAGVWDNSAIVVFADHGYSENAILGERFNPILFIKGINDSHNKMQISEKPVQYSDLEDAFIQLSNGFKSSDLFKNVNYPRTRFFLHSIWSEEDHIEEYQTDGKAWEIDKMTPTGNVYDLEK